MFFKLMRVLLALLSLAGVTVSVLALRVHNMDPSQQPPCAVTETFDCGAVNHSRYAVFPPRAFGEDPASAKLHIPVATIGIAGYAVMFLVAALGRWWILLQLSEIGFACACMLTYLEAFVMQKWCIYCLWSQGIVAAILLLAIVTVFAHWRTRRARLTYAA